MGRRAYVEDDTVALPGELTSPVIPPVVISARPGDPVTYRSKGPIFTDNKIAQLRAEYEAYQQRKLAALKRDNAMRDFLSRARSPFNRPY